MKLSIENHLIFYKKFLSFEIVYNKILLICIQNLKKKTIELFYENKTEVLNNVIIRCNSN